MRSVDSGQNRLEFKSQNHLFQPRCSWASWWTPPTLHIFIYKIRKIIAQRIVVKAKHNNPWKNLAQGLGFCLCNSYKKAKKKKKRTDLGQEKRQWILFHMSWIWDTYGKRKDSQPSFGNVAMRFRKKEGSKNVGLEANVSSSGGLWNKRVQRRKTSEWAWRRLKKGIQGVAQTCH